MRRILLFALLTIGSLTSHSQNLSYTCPRDTVLGCGVNCFDLRVTIPDLRTLGNNYTVDNVTSPLACYPFVGPDQPGPSTDIEDDDEYSDVITLPFTFPFWGANYNSLVVSTNGYLSFDPTLAGSDSHYEILKSGSALSATSGTPLDLPSALYDKALIMGPYHDIDPFIASPGKQIKYEVFGVAPNRKWVLSFNKIPLFQCTTLKNNTHQIILHETTGIIEVVIMDMQRCTGWNQGRSMIGLQDMTRTKAIMPANRKASSPLWGNVGMNETWRFTPVGGTSLYKKMELLDASGAVVATGDTTRLNVSNFEWTFPNVCPAGNAPTVYVVKTTYAKLNDPTQTIYSLDTIRVTKNAFKVNGSSTNTTCGATLGSVTATPAGGTWPFTYSLDGGPAQPDSVFTGLAPGTYVVTVTDANGCDNRISLTVATSSSLTGTATQMNVSCVGNSDGTITVTPTTGVAPYTYSANGGPSQTSNIFTGLAPGTYIIRFMDAAGCSGTVTRTLTQGSAISGNTNSTGTSCAGATNGTITANGSGGVGPYTYAIDGGAFQTSNIFTGVTSGTHSISIKDSRGCQVTISETVSSGVGLTSTVVTTQASCAGASNGTFTVTPTNGTGPYTYSIDGGPYQPGNVFTGLAPGSHTVIFRDVTTCSGTITRTVGAGSGLTATGTFTQTSCPGVSDGTITITPTNGTALYSYTIDAGTPQASNIFANVAAGTHSVLIKDANNCSGTVTVVVTAAPGLTGTQTHTSTSCAGVNDASITVTPGTPGTYTYTLNPGAITQNNNPVFTGLAPGTYTVTFSNAANCTATISNINITAGASLTATTTSTATSCPTRNDGTITVNPTGTGPFNFILNPGNVTQASPVFTGLAAGTYTITFSSASGCTGSVPVNPVVTAGPYLASTITTVHQPVCANINDGTITIVPGGTGPYSFTLTPGTTQASPTYTNLAPGPYTYNFTDANGCTGTGSFTLNSNPPIKTPSVKVMPLCNGNNNGTITFNTSGGVSPYQYALSPYTSFQAGNAFTGLIAGTYSFRIKDNVGCIKDTTVILAEPTVLTASAANTKVSTCNGNDGTITVTAGGGTTPYQYSINNGINYQSPNIFTAPDTGYYPNIKVKDAKGCLVNTSTTVALLDTMRLELGATQTICVESSITLQPQTNPGTNIFTWTAQNVPLSTLSDPGVKNPVATPKDTAIYTLNAQWGVCKRTDNITINVLHKPIVSAGLDTAICNQATQTIPAVATLTGSATDLSGTVNYAWEPANKVSFPTQPVTPARTDSTQNFVLTVTDNYGCNFVVKDTVTVFVQPPVQAFAGRDTIAMLNRPHQLMATGGTGYLWSPAGPLNDAHAQNPLATLTVDTRFTVVVTDIAGCEGYDTVFVKAYDGPLYYVPNAFTPNGDGRNDIFRAIPSGIASTEYFRVFNRFGELLFETNQWLKGWDGTYRGKKQPIGTYVWMVKGKDYMGRVVEQKGTVLIVQ